jgi:hypothetical protein
VETVLMGGSYVALCLCDAALRAVCRIWAGPADSR